MNDHQDTAPSRRVGPTVPEFHTSFRRHPATGSVLGDRSRTEIGSVCSSSVGDASVGSSSRGGGKKDPSAADWHAQQKKQQNATLLAVGGAKPFDSPSDRRVARPTDGDNGENENGESRRARFFEVQALSSRRFGRSLYSDGASNSHRPIHRSVAASDAASVRSPVMEAVSHPAPPATAAAEPVIRYGVSASGNSLLQVEIPDPEPHVGRVSTRASGHWDHQLGQRSQRHMAPLCDDKTFDDEMEAEGAVDGHDEDGWKSKGGKCCWVDEDRCIQYLQGREFRKTNALLASLFFFGLACFFLFGRISSPTGESSTGSFESGGGAAVPPDWLPPPLGMHLPDHIDSDYANWYDGLGGAATPQPLSLQGDVPFFFRIPMSGGSIAEAAFGSCVRLIQASEVGIVNGHGDDTALAVVQVLGQSYVNVDTFSPSGLLRARSLGLASSGAADVVHSPLLHEASTLFGGRHRGRVLTILRHPVHRAVAMFAYLKKATWDPSHDPELVDMTLEQYAMSPYVENNWVTRSLVNKKDGTLTSTDVTLAKEMLRRKVLVGLFEDISGVLQRFEQIFGWSHGEAGQSQAVVECRDRLIEEGLVRESTGELLPLEGSEAWELLLDQNRFDFALFEYAQRLVKYQVRLTKQRVN